MIPKDISEVTPQWMSEVLEQSVNTLEYTQIGQGVGIMGDIYRVTIDTNSDSVFPSVVVKLPSSAEENRAQGIALGMFEAEVRFYKELAGRVQVGLPQVYAAEIVAGTADFVIVMEDLSELTLVDQAAGMTAEQAMTAVEVLAHVHATWWDQARDPSLEWIPSMVGERISFVDQMLTDVLPVFLDGFGKALPPGGPELYERFAGNYLKVNQTLAARSPWTIVHQDFRVENLLFGPAGSGRMVILDWQGIGRGPGSYDLGYLLSGSMEPALRRTHEDNLLARYLDTLIDLGIENYSMQQLRDDYALSQLQGGLATSMFIGGGMDLSNARGKQLATTMASRHVTAALDHDGLSLINQIANLAD